MLDTLDWFDIVSLIFIPFAIVWGYFMIGLILKNRKEKNLDK